MFVDFYSLFLSLMTRDSVAEWSKACDSKSLLLWRRRFESCRCRLLLFLFYYFSISYISYSLLCSFFLILCYVLLFMLVFLFLIVGQCGRVVKAIDLKSISLWDRRFESCHCRFIIYLSFIYLLCLFVSLFLLSYPSLHLVLFFFFSFSFLFYTMPFIQSW